MLKCMGKIKIQFNADILFVDSNLLLLSYQRYREAIMTPVDYLLLIYILFTTFDVRCGPLSVFDFDNFP